MSNFLSKFIWNFKYIFICLQQTLLVLNAINGFRIIHICFRFVKKFRQSGVNSLHFFLLKHTPPFPSNCRTVIAEEYTNSSDDQSSFSCVSAVWVVKRVLLNLFRLMIGRAASIRHSIDQPVSVLNKICRTASIRHLIIQPTSILHVIGQAAVIHISSN